MFCVGLGLLLPCVAFLAIRFASSGSISLSVRREPGRRAAESRCVDCAQPGDFVWASLRVPAADSGSSCGIRAYLDRGLIASCDDCSDLGFAIQSIGNYEIVGVRVEAKLPGFLLSLFSAGDGETTTSRLEVR